tara:strand:- start:33 stop:413 length:381 start_codon:yes stop_codon:yes gene_type:complete
MTSVLNVDTIADKAGTGPVALTKQITAKSFEMHDDDNTTIVESFNTSSITDGSTGICAPVFTNNMATANYFTTAHTGDEGTSFGICDSTRYNAVATTSTYQYRTVNSSNNAADRKNTMSANIGDLA